MDEDDYLRLGAALAEIVKAEANERASVAFERFKLSLVSGGYIDAQRS